MNSIQTALQKVTTGLTALQSDLATSNSLALVATTSKASSDATALDQSLAQVQQDALTVATSAQFVLDAIIADATTYGKVASLPAPSGAAVVATAPTVVEATPLIWSIQDLLAASSATGAQALVVSLNGPVTLTRRDLVIDGYVKAGSYPSLQTVTNDLYSAGPGVYLTGTIYAPGDALQMSGTSNGNTNRSASVAVSGLITFSLSDITNVTGTGATAAASLGLLPVVSLGAGLVLNGNTLSVSNAQGYTLPVATSTALGGVKPGYGCTVLQDGTLNISPGGYVLPVATSTVLGGVKQGTGVTIANDGTLSVSGTNYSLPTATTSVLGGVKIDGTTITIANGVISGSSNYSLPVATTTVLGGVKIGTGLTVDGAGVVSANPGSISTASSTVLGGIKIGTGLAINSASGIASVDFTTMPTASTSVLGGVKVDGSTITITNGVISSAGGSGDPSWGTPQVITLAGTQAIDTSKRLVILNNTSQAINATLGAGTTDGQEIEIIILPGSTAGHSLTGTFFEASTTYSNLLTPEGGIALNLRWSTARSTWYPKTFDAGVGSVDLPATTSLSTSDQVGVVQAGIDKIATIGTVQNTLLSWGAPQVITTAGTQAIDTTKSLIIINNNSQAINATLSNGTVDGQEIEIIWLASIAAHSLAGTIYEASQTLSGVNSANGGVSLHLKWSAVRTSWYPRNYDSGVKVSDLPAGPSLVGTEKFGGLAGTTDRYWTAAQLATYSAENLPVWTTGTRPSLSGSQYGEGYNTTTGRFECWNGSTWYSKAKLTGDTFTGATGVAPFALTDGATINTDASKANLFTVTLAGNRTLANPTNLLSGFYYAWTITQDGTGSRTLTYGNLFTWKGGVAPTLSTAAGAVDVISGFYDGTKLRCLFAGAFA